jgi:glutaminyl-peptide cyclotransferase
MCQRIANKVRIFPAFAAAIRYCGQRRSGSIRVRTGFAETRFPMRAPIHVLQSGLALAGILWLACGSAPAPPPLPRAPLEGRVRAFSAERAWKHLEALAAIGPRASGTEGAAKARAYLRDELTSLGFEVASNSSTVSFDSGDQPDIELVNLEVTIPGDSPGLIVLVAPYDSAYHESFEYLGVNDGASGAALLLELARVLHSNPLPYAIRLYFLDGEAPLGRGGPDDKKVRLLGSTLAAATLESRGELAAIRLLIAMNRVSDADLRIARDRFSHRTYRDAIWRAAAELGYVEAFPPGEKFEAPLAGHRPFIDRGMRRAVAIVDPHFGDEEAPDFAEHSEEDTLDRSSPRSLEVVGKVTLAGLESISARLVKIDRFSRAPGVVEPEPRTGVESTPPEEGGPAEEGAPPEEGASLEEEGVPEEGAPPEAGSDAEPLPDSQTGEGLQDTAAP